MQMTTWRPFRDMEEIFRRNSPLFDMRSGATMDKNGQAIANWSPSADISETKKGYLIKAELPDVNKEDIHVSVQDGTLTIEGEREYSKEEEDETCHRVESFYGNFSRSFSLPSNADESGISAKYKKGVLRIRMPKTKEVAKEKSAQIEVT